MGSLFPNTPKLHRIPASPSPWGHPLPSRCPRIRHPTGTGTQPPNPAGDRDSPSSMGFPVPCATGSVPQEPLKPYGTSAGTLRSPRVQQGTLPARRGAGAQLPKATRPPRVPLPARSRRSAPGCSRPIRRSGTVGRLHGGGGAAAPRARRGGRRPRPGLLVARGGSAQLWLPLARAALARAAQPERGPRARPAPRAARAPARGGGRGERWVRTGSRYRPRSEPRRARSDPRGVPREGRPTAISRN